MGHNYVGHNYIGHDYRGHDCIGHGYIGHAHTGHNYTNHSYVGHNYVSHNYVGHDYLREAGAADVAENRLRARQIPTRVYRLYIGIADGVSIARVRACRYSKIPVP